MQQSNFNKSNAFQRFRVRSPIKRRHGMLARSTVVAYMPLRVVNIVFYLRRHDNAL